MSSSNAKTSLLSKVGFLVGIDMIAGAYGAYLGQGIHSGGEVLGLFLLSIVMLFVIQGLNGVSSILAAVAAVVFSGVLGAMVAPEIMIHARTIGWHAVAFAFLGSYLAMVLFGMIGAFSGRDFSSWGPFLLQMLVGLIVVRFILLLLPGMTQLSILSGVGGVVLFAGYFIYDFYQASHDDNTWASAVDHSVEIYLDFVNFAMSVLEAEDGK